VLLAQQEELQHDEFNNIPLFHKKSLRI